MLTIDLEPTAHRSTNQIVAKASFVSFFPLLSLSLSMYRLKTRVHRIKMSKKEEYILHDWSHPRLGARFWNEWTISDYNLEYDGTMLSTAALFSMVCFSPLSRTSLNSIPCPCLAIRSHVRSSLSPGKMPFYACEYSWTIQASARLLMDTLDLVSRDSMPVERLLICRWFIAISNSTKFSAYSIEPFERSMNWVRIRARSIFGEQDFLFA